MNDSDFREAKRAIFGGMCHLMAMMFFAAAVGGLIFQQTALGDNAVAAANENSIIEHLQLFLLAATFALLGVLAIRIREGREGFLLTAALFLCMAIRECDGILDTALFHGSWFPIGMAVALAAVIVAARRFRNTVAGLAAIVREKSFGILCAGLSMIFVFSRILGHKAIWSAISRHLSEVDVSKQLTRSLKNTAEEGTELFGYAIILFWAVSFAVPMFSRAPKTRKKSG